MARAQAAAMTPDELARHAFGLRWRRVAEVILVIGILLPVSAKIRSTWGADGTRTGSSATYLWAWDVATFKARDGGPMMAAFLFLPALAGLVCWCTEKNTRRDRGILALALGGLPVLALAFAGKDALAAAGVGTGWQALSLALTATLAGGALAALRDETRPAGYLIAGVSGALSLVMLLLPIAPAVGQPRGETANAITNFLAVLRAESSQLKLLEKAVFALVFLAGTAVPAYAASLLAPAMRTRPRARVLVLMLAGILLLTLVAPLVPILSAPEGADLTGYILLILALIGTRLVPCLLLITFGVADLIDSGRAPAPARAGAAADDAGAPPAWLARAKAIDADHRAMQAGTLEGAEFLARKRTHLKAAALDARTNGTTPALLSAASKLHARGALNDTELESLRTFLAG